MRKVFLNVVILAALLAVGAGAVMGILASIGAASIVVPVGVSITVGYLTIALIFARKSGMPRPGKVTRLSVNALALFAAAWIVFPAALQMGGEAYLTSIASAIDPQGIAIQKLLGQVSPVAGAAIGVLMAFAQGDQAEEDDGDMVLEAEIVESEA